MFSQKIITRNIDRWIAAGKFKPVYHSIAECERAIAHFNSLVQIDYETGKIVSTRDPDKLPVDTFTSEENQWIKNERLLCRLDYRYWKSRYVWIKNEEDKVVKMIPWRSQEIFLDIISEMQEQEIAIMLQILKARQLGISREISLILDHGVLFFPNINAFMASSTEEKTGLLFDMVDFVNFRLPWWMVPQEKFRRENKFIEWHNGSAITLQHGQQSTGIARGTTPTKAHICELAEFKDPSSLIDSALLRAMHDSPDTFLTLEGTAEDIEDWWHKKWKSSKAFWPEGRARLRPLFLPWFVGGLYPKSTWLRAHPMPADYSTKMLPWAYDHAQMAEEYVRSTDYLRKHLGSNWIMPLDQIWYYECERDAAIRERRLNKFLQEMPANDDEAFQSANVSVFDAEVITYYRDNAHRQPLLGVYGLRGPRDYMPERLQPSSLLIDVNKPVIPIRANWGTGYPIPFELVPLRFDGWSLEDDSSIDKIYLWERPVDGHTYGFGIDTSDGIGKDRSVIEIMRKGDIFGPPKQIGEFASSKMNALDVVPFALALGTYFSVYDSKGELQQPRMAIECKGNGDQAQLRLKLLGWTNFHPWVDREIDAKQIDLSRFNKIGIYTSTWFRAGLIEMLVKTIRDVEIEICSPFMVKELATLEGDDFNQSLRAAYGSFDDRVLALGFILVSLYKFDRQFNTSPHAKAYQGRMLPQQQNKPKQYAKWADSWQTRSDAGIYTE